MKNKYKLPTKEDHDILAKCEQLEKLKLNVKDKALVALVKSQLEDDWRKPLIETLNKLL